VAINFFIKTFGCQANVADSEHLSKFLMGLGCLLVLEERVADLILVNTCAIRQKAEQKLFSYLGEIEDLNKSNRHLKIGVIGCVATYKGEHLRRRFHHVNFTFGAKENISYLKDFLAELVEAISSRKQVSSSKTNSSKVASEVSFDGKFKSCMINIMRGCNNFCSYCIVPFTTGRERNQPVEKILEQVREQVRFGSKEIVLLGQNVNSYKDPETGCGFAQLLEKVALIPGDFWVRFMSPHPKDMGIDVVRIIAKYNKICTNIHLPMQSGSDKILNLMNRKYTAENFMQQVEMIRKELPEVTLTTDIIVGFPGEDEIDFERTVEIVRAANFSTIFSFIYSPRKFTKAADFEDNCLLSVKKERLAFLQDLYKEIGTKQNNKLVGQRLQILLDQKVNEYCFLGRTQGNIRVKICGTGLKINDFVLVEIEKSGLTSSLGRLISVCDDSLINKQQEVAI
jgi:tRNA-2-methylthio-N6-dimethylallyladenosine synthase